MKEQMTKKKELSIDSSTLLSFIGLGEEGSWEPLSCSPSLL